MSSRSSSRLRSTGGNLKMMPPSEPHTGTMTGVSPMLLSAMNGSASGANHNDTATTLPVTTLYGDVEDVVESVEEEEEDVPLYCICRQPDNFDFMIECDACENWFHGRCVNMNRKKARAAGTWLCPPCMQAGRLAEVIAAKSSVSAEKVAPEPADTQPKAKKLKSSSQASRDKKNVDIRQRALDSLIKCLNAGRDALRQHYATVSNKADADASKSNGKVANGDLDVPGLAAALEAAIFDKMATPDATGQLQCGDLYRRKVMSLYVNMKARHNAEKLFRGDCQPVEFVDMSAEELADDQLKRLKKTAQEESMRGSVITEDLSAVIFNKTATSKNVKPAVKTESEMAPVQLADETKTTIDTPESASEPPTAAVTVAVTSRDLKAESVTLLDDLLAKVSTPAVTTVSPVKRKFDDNVSEVADTPDSARSSNNSNTGSKDQIAAIASGPAVWAGQICAAGAVSTMARAVQVGGLKFSTDQAEQRWESLLPPVLHVSGRIARNSVWKYIGDLLKSSSKRTVMLIALPPKDTGAAEAAEWQAFHDYYHSRERCAVIGNCFKSVRDMYIIPLARDDALPDFLSTIDHSLAATGRDADILLGVVIATTLETVNKAPVATVKPEIIKPAEAAVVDAPPVVSASALSLLNSLMSQGVLGATKQQPQPAEYNNIMNTHSNNNSHVILPPQMQPSMQLPPQQFPQFATTAAPMFPMFPPFVPVPAPQQPQHQPLGDPRRDHRRRLSPEPRQWSHHGQDRRRQHRR